MRREFERRFYFWNGRVWLDEDRLQVSDSLANQLTDRFLEEWLDPKAADWLRLAGHMRRSGVDLESQATLRLVERACRRYLALNPGDLGTLAILCACLRNLRQPQQALRVTDDFADCAHAPLLTSRAAALCDLGRWDEAERVVFRALNLGGAGPALQVLYRTRARQG